MKFMLTPRITVWPLVQDFFSFNFRSQTSADERYREQLTRALRKMQECLGHRRSLVKCTSYAFSIELKRVPNVNAYWQDE